MKSSQYWLKAFLLVSVLLSICLIVWGSNKGSNLDIYTVILTIGAAFLGVTSGMFLDQLIEKRKSHEVLDEVVENSRDIKKAILKEEMLISNEAVVNTILGKWNHYNVTKKNGEYYWIHTIYDIYSDSLGGIRFDVVFKDNKGGEAIYQYSGFVRDDRTVFVGKPKNGEQPCFIEVFPHLVNYAVKYHCGFCINQSWDMHETLIPCILSRKPLMNKSKINHKQLDEIWEKGMNDANFEIFPRVFQKQKVKNE